MLIPCKSGIKGWAVCGIYSWKLEAVAYRGGRGSNLPPPPKFRRPSKIVPNSNQFSKLLKIAEFRTPTPQDVRKKGSKILKLPPVRNFFTLAMTNKLVVIINSLKVPKIKKILLYEMKFLVPNYSCLHNPWLGGYRPQIPVFSVLNWICWTPPPHEKNSWVRHWLEVSNLPLRFWHNQSPLVHLSLRHCKHITITLGLSHWMEIPEVTELMWAGLTSLRIFSSVHYIV